jgi:hypothetical protein
VLLPDAFKGECDEHQEKTRKALSLNSETLRTLDRAEVATVAGGAAGANAAAISWNGPSWSWKSCIACPA